MIGKTIYISVPSIEDKEILETVRSAFTLAEDPSRVFMGISFFDKTDELFLKVKNLNNKNITCEYNKLTEDSFNEMGTGNGRVRAANLYSGQDFILQIDSHTLFAKNWDTILINLFDEFKEIYGNDRFIFTGYPAKYKYTNEGKREFINDRPFYPYFYPDQFFLNKIPAWDMDDLEKKITKKFIPCVKFCGGFAFGSKHFVENSGVYKDAIFYDEEMIQSFNLVGNNTAMVFLNINNFPISHLYSDDINEYGGDRQYFTSMFNNRYDQEFTKKCVSNYISYIGNPENYILIKKYEKYARINVKKGAIGRKYVPKKFVVEDGL